MPYLLTLPRQLGNQDYIHSCSICKHFIIFPGTIFSWYNHVYTYFAMI